uniref:Uncharacterized protein n=1 Tax=Arundo donax TaxID=35708 RepID=A0A0A9CJJ9_ARUDO
MSMNLSPFYWDDYLAGRVSARMAAIDWYMIRISEWKNKINSDFNF